MYVAIRPPSPRYMPYWLGREEMDKYCEQVRSVCWPSIREALEAMGVWLPKGSD